jgi:hypothetical protein
VCTEGSQSVKFVFTACCDFLIFRAMAMGWAGSRVERTGSDGTENVPKIFQLRGLGSALCVVV